jgi:hypothetical protein
MIKKFNIINNVYSKVINPFMYNEIFDENIKIKLLKLMESFKRIFRLLN